MDNSNDETQSILIHLDSEEWQRYQRLTQSQGTSAHTEIKAFIRWRLAGGKRLAYPRQFASASTSQPKSTTKRRKLRTTTIAEPSQEEMSLAQLKQVAQDNGITGYTVKLFGDRRSKQAWLEAIRAVAMADAPQTED